MFGFGMPELVLILVICLVVFGPGKLPQLGSSLGGAIKGFRRATEEPLSVDTTAQGAEAGARKEA
ncbi:twin-arginine translocase TatA/TatE family subunit [Trichlorobacter lovleyi]|uniref:twin-arginine translocase TatA/TatE family subunit n=1 Tax=Trichlorobacter lovleyi TaxID=313985 RepID=UPI00223ECF37|nr:twin-arginine translocase TatA/TatE family subunit [Trichlorobacter lovleyi]QOX80493.1 twin-arginine translocase TatA/TatE family subunit [Trichlorobacter lovleyi]